MNKISFFTPISYNTLWYSYKKTWSDRLLQLADNYFFFGGEKAFVTEKKFTITEKNLNRAYDNIQYIETYKNEKFFTHDEKVSTLKKTILIGSYFFTLGILPLVVLITKAALRHQREFSMINNVLPSYVNSSYIDSIKNTIIKYILQKNFKDLNPEEITYIEENENYNTYVIKDFPKLFIKIQHNKENAVLNDRSQELINAQKMKLINGSNEIISNPIAYTINGYQVLIEDIPQNWVPTYDYKDIKINYYALDLGLDLDTKFTLIDEHTALVGVLSVQFENEYKVSLQKILDDVAYAINQSMRRQLSHSSYKSDNNWTLDIKNNCLNKYKTLSTNTQENLLKTIIKKFNKKNIVPWSITLQF